MNFSTDFTKQDLIRCLEKSRELGFISDQPVENQIDHSWDFLELIPDKPGITLDLGAGGGLPSLVYLHKFQDREITALDAMRKRTDFLENSKADYQSLLMRLKVINGRAEILSYEPQFQHSFDLVLARGFSTPQITAECATRFLKVGGHLIVSGRPIDEESRWKNEGLSSLGFKIEEIKNSDKAHAAVLYKYSLENPKYPRRAAAMKSSPLW